MARKPVVVYVESERDEMAILVRKENAEQKALQYVLEHDYGFEVWHYERSSYLEKDLDTVARYAKAGITQLVVIKQERYEDNCEVLISRIRSSVSSSVPIVVIPEIWAEKQFEDHTNDPNLVVGDHGDPRLFEILDQIVRDWKPMQGWLEAYRPADVEERCHQLLRAYWTHYVVGPDSEATLAVGDHNHMTIAEALRIRLLPFACIKAEFDETLEAIEGGVEYASGESYLRDLEYLRALDEAGRIEFNVHLMRERGYEQIPGSKCIRVVSETCGDTVGGFAIDAVTLQSVVINQYGFHYYAGELLQEKVNAIEALRRKQNRFEFDESSVEWYKREITGLIFYRTGVTATSVVQLSWEKESVPQEDVERVAKHLFSEGKLIPVDFELKLLPGI